MIPAFVLGALIISIAESLKSCDDCVDIFNCQPAMQLVANDRSENTRSILMSYLCNVGRRPKICCSDFAELKQEDDVETHPNVNLLPSDCGDINGSRLLGGYASLLPEFPWLVFIAYRVNTTVTFRCTGTMINNRYVLTTASCIKNKQIYGVRIGAQDTMFTCAEDYCERNYQDIAVSEAIPHQEYTNHPSFCPIFKSLITENADAICLPISKNLREMNMDNENATIAGWGFMDNTQTNNYTPLVSVITIYPEHTCNLYYNRRAISMDQDSFKNKLCGERGNRLPCDEPGVPLMYENYYNGIYKYVQLGITVLHSKRCSLDEPEILTDVRKYVKWILDSIKP